jgi:predicted XRE-type DNA-binding protein
MKEQLLKAIKARGFTSAYVITKLGISPSTWFRRLRNNDWRRIEIQKLKKILKLSDNEVRKIFF